MEVEVEIIIENTRRQIDMESPIREHNARNSH